MVPERRIASCLSDRGGSFCGQGNINKITNKFSKFFIILLASAENLLYSGASCRPKVGGCKYLPSYIIQCEYIF